VYSSDKSAIAGCGDALVHCIYVCIGIKTRRRQISTTVTGDTTREALVLNVLGRLPPYKEVCVDLMFLEVNLITIGIIQ